MPLKKIDRKGDWEQVEDVDGYKHWVAARLTADGVKCAVAMKDRINIRSGPGTNFTKTPLSPVEKYYSFKVLETKGDWVKVQDEVNNVGWISARLLWVQ